MLFGFLTSISYREHPSDWHRVETRHLAELDAFAVNDWLRGMAQGDYDIAGATYPHTHLVVFFERISDAVWFKLTWGGNR